MAEQEKHIKLTETRLVTCHVIYDKKVETN